MFFKIVFRPQEVIVFIIGGITYEETSAIQSINRAYAGNIKIVIGGTHVHNFNSFQQEVIALTSNSSVNEVEEYRSRSNQLRSSLASAMLDRN